MFELSYGDSGVLEKYKKDGNAYKDGIYDCTFENEFIIFHVTQRNAIDYIALDMATGFSSLVVTIIAKSPGDLYTKASYVRLIPDILYAIRYTGDERCIAARVLEKENTFTIERLARIIREMNLARVPQRVRA